MSYSEEENNEIINNEIVNEIVNEIDEENNQYSGTDSGTDSETDSRTDSRTDSGTDSETDSGTDSDLDSDDPLYYYYSDTTDNTNTTIEPFRFKKPNFYNIKIDFIKNKTEKLIDASNKFDRIVIVRKYEIDQDCSICYVSMKNKNVYYLPCNHVYHKNCLKQQINEMYYMKKNCALCRKDLTEYLKPFNNLN